MPEHDTTTIPIIISSLALVVAITGWFISYQFNIRASRLNRRWMLLNEARTAFNDSTTEYIEWLSDVSARLQGVSSHADTENPILKSLIPDWLKELRTVLLDKTAYRWIRVLEEYEVLLPQTAVARRELLGDQRLLLDAIYSACSEIDTKKGLLALKINGSNWHEQIMDQTSLVWDLRIYVQNLCMGELVGHRAPERAPVSNQVPVLKQDKDGVLRIVRTGCGTAVGGAK